MSIEGPVEWGMDEVREWAKRQSTAQRFFRSGDMHTARRDFLERKEYEKFGLAYACGVTPNDVLWKLAERGESYGIEHVEIHPLYTESGIRIVPGHLVILEGESPDRFLEIESPRPNLDTGYIPKVLGSDLFRKLKTENAYLATLRIINAEKFIDSDDEGLFVRGPRGIILEPTFVELRRTA